MSDDEKTAILRGEVFSPDDPMHGRMPHVPAPPGHSGVINLWGRLRLHANRKGAERYADMIEAYERAHLSMVKLLQVKERLNQMSVRFEPDMIEAIKEQEREKVRAVTRRQLEDEFRHEERMATLAYEKAAAEARLKGFAHDQEMIAMRRQIEKRELEAQLYGKSTHAEPTNEEKLAVLMEKAKKHHEEYAAAMAANPHMSTAEKDMWRRREMAIQDEIEKHYAT